MTITTPPQQADTVLARDYERLKPDILRTVRGKLAASGVRFDDSDLDGFYNQAWHGVHTKLAEGERVENVNGLLVTITQRRALDEFRALRAESRVDAESLLAHGVEPDFAAQVDDHTRLRQFIEGMRERLSGREREAAALCYVQDYTRPEAASVMGIKPRRMEKIMDGVSKKVGAFVGDIERDEWCDARHSMIKAYALGLLDPEGERYALAQEHLESCSACRRDVLRMRGIAALGPPPALLFAAVGAAGAAGAGGAGGHFVFHGGGVAAKSTTLAVGGSLAVAGSIAAVALTTHQKSEPPLFPTPTPTLVARVTPTPTPPPVATAVPQAVASHKAKAVVKHHHKKKKHHKVAPAATAAPVRTAVPTVAPRPAVTVQHSATPAPQKKVSQDGAGEFELGSGKQK